MALLGATKKFNPHQLLVGGGCWGLLGPEFVTGPTSANCLVYRGDLLDGVLSAVLAAVAFVLPLGRSSSRSLTLLVGLVQLAGDLPSHLLLPAVHLLPERQDLVPQTPVLGC